MNAKELLQSAQLLQQPSVKAAQEFDEKSELLALQMNLIMANREDITQLIGEKNLNMMEDNHRNHLRFLSSLFYSYQPQTLVETVLWVFRAYRSHGFKLTYWPAQLSQWVELFKTHLSKETYQEIYPFYHWMIVNQSSFVIESDRVILSDNTPLHEVS